MKAWNSRTKAEDFVSRYRLTFTNLWDETDAVWRRYGRPYHSKFWLIRKDGTRVGNNEVSSVSEAQRLLDGLE